MAFSRLTYFAVVFWDQRLLSVKSILHQTVVFSSDLWKVFWRSDVRVLDAWILFIINTFDQTNASGALVWLYLNYFLCFQEQSGFNRFNCRLEDSSPFEIEAIESLAATWLSRIRRSSIRTIPNIIYRIPSAYYIIINENYLKG